MTSYWQDPNLKLYFNSSADHSIDEYGAKKYSKSANVSKNYVFDMQSDLVATGYLNGVPDGDYGPKTKRAVIRF